MAICTDIEPLVAALLRAATKISLVFRLEATCVGGRLALFETEANCSVAGNPHIAKRYRAAKTPALCVVPGRHLLGSAVVTSAINTPLTLVQRIRGERLFSKYVGQRQSASPIESQATKTFVLLRRLTNKAALKRKDFRRRYDDVEH